MTWKTNFIVLISLLVALGACAVPEEDTANAPIGDGFLDDGFVAEDNNRNDPDSEDPIDEDPQDPTENPIDDPEDDPVDPPEEELSGTCTENAFTPNPGGEAAFLEGYGVLYQSIGNTSTTTALILEIHDDRAEGPVEPGVYDLKDSDLSTCRVCVLACHVADNRCSKIFMAKEGSIEITAKGDAPGGSFQFQMSNVLYREVTISQNPLTANDVLTGQTFCADGQQGNASLTAQPARIGEPVRDFQLQNCLSEEFVSIHDIASEKKALWAIATTGWCPACRTYIPQAIDIGGQLSADDLRMIFVVGENANYAQPTAAYCRQYASTYGEDGSRFYIDHDGQNSFASTFSNMYVYPNSQGAFGLPWNAVVGGDFVYEYADGDGTNRQATSVVNGLVQ